MTVSMYLSVLFFLSLGLIVNAQEGVKIPQREKKLFSLFTIVNFPNNQCTAKSDNTMFGTCLTESECATRSGSVDGNCAAGFGVCCTFTLSACASTVTENCTYIQNPSYPSSYSTAGDCIYSVTPLNSDICQLRLDFDTLDIGDNAVGTCIDTFQVAGPSNRYPPALCGTLTGTHLYVEQGRSTTSATITIGVASTASGGTWKIKVTQIECSSASRARPDCYQWFTGVSGTVQSYNWPVVQLQNTITYTCLRQERGYCGVQWSVYGVDSPDPFITTDDEDGMSLNNMAAVKGWVQIPGAEVIQNYSGDNFCQGLFVDGEYECAVDGTVTTTDFTIAHHVAAADNTGELGYKLSYTQIPCFQSIGATMRTILA